MKVFELIEELKKMPQDIEVIVYSELSEDHGYPSYVCLVETKEDEAYDKGDQPSRVIEDVFPYVRIG